MDNVIKNEIISKCRNLIISDYVYAADNIVLICFQDPPLISWKLPEEQLGHVGTSAFPQLTFG